MAGASNHISDLHWVKQQVEISAGSSDFVRILSMLVYEARLLLNECLNRVSR
jgi:hypothetical protein